jgi:hypothetical protein
LTIFQQKNGSEIKGLHTLRERSFIMIISGLGHWGSRISYGFIQWCGRISDGLIQWCSRISDGFIQWRSRISDGLIQWFCNSESSGLLTCLARVGRLVFSLVGSSEECPAAPAADGTVIEPEGLLGRRLVLADGAHFAAGLHSLDE